MLSTMTLRTPSRVYGFDVIPPIVLQVSGGRQVNRGQIYRDSPFIETTHTALRVVSVPDVTLTGFGIHPGHV